MALNWVALSAGDQRNWGAGRPASGDLRPAASALARVSGDSCLVAGPGAPTPGAAPRPAARPSVWTESRRAAGGGRTPTRLIKARDADARSRGRQPRFSPYPTPGVKLDLLRSVLQQRLRAPELWPPAPQLHRLPPSISL
ncbi:PREDICTED: uncharacterized protein C11orf71 homolog [Condylura cristata]|uniref:uncharacterized protein C11orf71 homolog n=1 Tax=Condylura cristata TaxID=143302 RepID=UPI000334543F|nr:PREDICTED: uncharacterized protein C11orf71 homolog [Condylura cristata]